MISARSNDRHSDDKSLFWRENLRTYRIASWLGWQVEGNWADPLVFFIFTVMRPMATALILLIMYQVIAGGQKGAFFDYLYISNAFFVLVIQGMSGMAFAVLDDREDYKMLKYIYTSPARWYAYLLGRATAKIAIGLLTTLILLAVGILFLGLGVDLGRVQWGWLAAYFVPGLASLIGLGIVMAGIALVVSRNAAAIGEITAGLVLLFSGAYFPPDILPPLLRDISLWNPITYWLEGIRRALAGGLLTFSPPGSAPGSKIPVSPALAVHDNAQLLLIVALSAVAVVALSYAFHRWVENQAKERGMIDRLTGY